MKKTTGLAALAALCAIASPAAAKPKAARADARAPFSAQDLVTLPRLGGAAVSGDGTMAVYPVTETDPASFKRSTALFVRSLADAKAMPRRIDLGGTASSPAFGDDGWLYFLSDRGEGGSDQVWRARISADGSAADVSQVTALKAAVAGFALSPDATRIAVWGDVGRECAGFGCDPDGSTHLPGPGTGRLYDASTGFVRHWDQWETPGVYGRTFAFPLVGGKATGDGVPLDGPAGKGALVGDTPTKPFGGGEDVAWAANGHGLFFAARKADADEPRSTNIDLWFNDLSGRAPVNLTQANEGTDTLPAPSPDGKWLAYAAMARPGYEADKLTVMLRELATGKVRALTTDWDRSAGSLAWTPDSRWIVATAGDVLDTPVFRIDPVTGKVEKLDLMAGNEAHIGDVVPLSGGDLVFTRNSIGAPNELYLSKNWGQATPLTDAATSIMGKRAPIVTRRFSFRGANGDTVWGQITKLDGKKGPMPAILYVHGGPQGSFDDSWSSRWNPRVVASQGYAVVSVDFHGSTGYGQAFTDSITNDWGGKPLEDLQKGFAAAVALDGQIDGDNACAMGASYGGYMMNWIAGRWPDKFKCLVQHDGVFDARAMAYETEELWFDTWEHGGKTYFEDPAAYEKWNPVNYVDNWKTPMLVITSEKDFRIPYTQGLAAFTALQMKGVPGQLLVFPDENHWVLKGKNSLQWHKTVFDWLDRWLKPAQTSGK
ncbi:prolyl oligopeptidase [Tsuneonella deserti]|uniref:Prolyl oligopeptidase n=1 Tax=Tsuneonella deserti TaxID=2035528 RepID=A0ABQ1SDP1_9SPHN|nr:S9 family peptidase [Tsuneonella deserti]GGE04091.1 prolyl oligopeptidase [Tsuneonella deserti]